MFEAIFEAITALATTVTAGVVVFELWKKYSAQPSCLTITGRSYYHREGSDVAELRFELKSKQRIRIQGFSVKDASVSLQFDGPYVKYQNFGLSLEPSGRDYHLEFYVKPQPKNGKAVELKLDVGRIPFMNPKYSFHPNDFSVSGIPDLGQWPVDRSHY